MARWNGMITTASNPIQASFSHGNCSTNSNVCQDTLARSKYCHPPSSCIEASHTRDGAGEAVLVVQKEQSGIPGKAIVVGTFLVQATVMIARTVQELALLIYQVFCPLLRRIIQMLVLL